MSRLSTLDNPLEVITSHSEVCNCGRKITRESDKKNGICRLCNPFSEVKHASTKSFEADWDNLYQDGRTNSALSRSDYHVNRNPLE